MPAAVHPAQRLWYGVRVNDKTNCWEWTKNKNPQGYGMIGVYGRLVRTHRFSYELMVGDIPTGLLVCHKCDNPSCINPAHLFLGTHKDNAADRQAKGRGGPSHVARVTQETGRCMSGRHERTEENIFYSKEGWKVCRLCRAERQNRYYRERRKKAGAVVATHSYTPDVQL